MHDGVLKGLPIFLLAIFAAAAAGQNGAAVYRQNCSKCHDTGAGRAPTREIFTHMSPETVQAALMQGSMWLQGMQMSHAEVRDVATFVTGKAFSPPAKELFACSRQAPMDKPLDAPHWNGWGVDGSNDRAQPASMARLDASEVPRLKLKWAFGFAGAFRAYSQPTVVGGRVYVGGSNGKVYSLDAHTGCVYWSFDAEATVRNAPTVGRIGTDWAVFFGDIGGHAYALNADTGRQIWMTHVEAFPVAVVTGSPTLYGDRLYVPMSTREEVSAMDAAYECCRQRGSLSALDARTGRVIWKSYTIAAAPRALKKNSQGAQQWGPSGASIISAPTIDSLRHAVYVGTGNSHSNPASATSDAFLAFSMSTGKLLWTSQMTAGDASNMACSVPGKVNCPEHPGNDVGFLGSPMLVNLGKGKRALIAGEKSGWLHAVDPDRRGKLLWREALGNGVIGWGSATDGHTVYTAFSGAPHAADRYFDPKVGGGLFALETASGRRIWSAPPPHSCTPEKHGCSPGQPAAVTLIPGVVFSGALDGHLRAYSTNDGRAFWDYDTSHTFKTVNGVAAYGGSMDGPGPVIVDGMLFVNSGYGLGGGMPGNVLLAFSLDGK